MSRAHREAGLTLLEVLAATMIFALVMTTLIGTSSALVRRVTQSLQRLEANLLADRVVADLEIEMRKGKAPVLEKTEWSSEDEQYVVRVLNRTIQEALAAPATSVAEEAAAEAGATPPTSPGATTIGGASGIGTLLAGQLPEVAKHLRQYDVEVAWSGIGGPESVTRTTFAFDWQAAKVEFAALFESGEDGLAGEGDEDANPDGAQPQRPQPNGPGGGLPTP